MINRLSNLINRNRSAAKISKVMSSNDDIDDDNVIDDENNDDDNDISSDSLLSPAKQSSF